MKKICIFLLVAAFVLTSPVLSAADYEERRTPVIFTYDEALRLALNEMLTVQDIDIQIREAQDHRSDLRDELRALERGDWTRERTDELFDLLWEIEMQLFNAAIGQEQSSINTGQALQLFLLSVANIHEEGADALLLQSLQFTIWNMLSAQSMSNNTAHLEHQRQLIFTELDSLFEGDLVRELTADTRYSIGELDRHMQNLRLQQEQARLVRENALRTAIITIAELDSSIAVTEIGLDLAKEDLRRITIRYEFGRISSNAFRTAEQNLQFMQMELEELLRGHHTAMRNLNHLLGQPLTQLTVVEIERHLPEFPENMQNHMTATIQDTPAIRQLALEVTRTREARRVYTGNDRETRNALQEAYDRAVLGQSQAALAMEVTMRRRYSELESLINRNEALNLELTQAQSRLEVALHNLTLGRITYHEVEQARFAIFVVEQHIESVYNEKWLLAFLLENPSLA